MTHPPPSSLPRPGSPRRTGDDRTGLHGDRSSYKAGLRRSPLPAPLSRIVFSPSRRGSNQAWASRRATAWTGRASASSRTRRASEVAPSRASDPRERRMSVVAQSFPSLPHDVPRHPCRPSFPLPLASRRPTSGCCCSARASSYQPWRRTPVSGCLPRRHTQTSVLRLR